MCTLHPAYNVWPSAPSASLRAASPRGAGIAPCAAVKRRRSSHADGDEQPDSRDEGGLQGVSRREVMLNSVSLAALGLGAPATGTSMSGRTVVNSLLGAYGLPQLPADKGFKLYDEFEEASGTASHVCS